ncbi:MAG: ABC transporter ATP-binding protein [Thermoflexia bacterium]|nr:MAG: ABC transporter ATP-binding protein [Thermoflexia bacterium]
MPDALLAVEMRGIVKRFPGVLANDHVDLAVRAGEVHALLGENGAGKTTLMNILYGIYHPDEGEILIKGNPVRINSPSDATRLGIGMVHQHFRLVPSHTVVENVVLGLPRPFFFPDRAARQKLREFAQRYGLNVDPDARVWQLSAGEQQRVEIVKALYRGADILILDEPTSMLTPQEIRELMATVRQMAAEGKTVIFITHKLDEVFAASDRVTVLRQGKVIATLETSQTDKRELARLMVGRDVLFRLEKKPVQPGPTVLEVKNLYVRSDRGPMAVKGVSFHIAAGEILGIAGVAGNGQRELAEALAGLRPIVKGQVLLQGKDMSNHPPRILAREGVCYVPAERLVGTVPNLSVAENLILKAYDQSPFCRGIFLNREAIENHADRLIAEYGVATPSRETPIKLLSGGNIQRAILARETSCSPRLLIAVHPTSGLDIGATEYIRQTLLAQREQGTAILLVSEDLEEILQLSDRIAVMYGGEIMGILPAEQADLETIGLMMAGIHREVA